VKLQTTKSIGPKVRVMNWDQIIDIVIMIILFPFTVLTGFTTYLFFEYGLEESFDWEEIKRDWFGILSGWAQPICFISFLYFWYEKYSKYEHLFWWN